ncbi:MAG: PilZ domain-containing protein [Gemmatimonadota bacterium]
MVGWILGSAAASGADQYLQFDQSVNVGVLKWAAIALVVVVAALILRQYVRARLGLRDGSAPPNPQQENPEEGFRARATELGFRGAEYRTLKKIATRMAPKTPGALLVSETGREYLVADLRRRAERRQRELDVLRGIRDRVGRLSGGDLRERLVVRMDADLAVWVEHRRRGEAAVPPRGAVARPPTPPPEPPVEAEAAEPHPGADEPEGEPTADAPEEIDAVFANLKSVEGRLLDLGTGGAALQVDLQARSGDIVEVWSADREIYMPRTSADVVSVEGGPGGEPPILHLRFLDADVEQLAAAIADIQERQARHDRDGSDDEAPQELLGRGE